MMSKLFSRNKEISLSEAKADDLRGEWLAIIDDKIVAHNKNLTKVRTAAQRKYKGRKLTLTRVPISTTAMY